MADDLVERLRAIGEAEMYESPASTKALIDEAADAIESLRAENARLTKQVANLEARGIHSCNDECQRPLCVAQRENARLREALVAEREDNLWNAYNTGSVRDGKWDHLCMSDGEWLARECGFNVSDCRFDDEAIRAAIPKAARKALKDVNA
jgi:hypothetical protein